jgi:hypothetical protein
VYDGNNWSMAINAWLRRPSPPQPDPARYHATCWTCRSILFDASQARLRQRVDRHCGGGDRVEGTRVTG